MSVRAQTFWVAGPDEEEGPASRSILCRRLEGPVAVDGDRAIIPSTLIESADGTERNEAGYLVQYGGSDLLLDLYEHGIEEGDRFWVVNRRDRRPFIEPDDDG